MSGWHLHHGKWWAIQWSFDGWISLGIHIDLKSRESGRTKYGPYVDFHVGCLIVSIGRNPAYSGDLELMKGSSRGGIRA